MLVYNIGILHSNYCVDIEKTIIGISDTKHKLMYKIPFANFHCLTKFYIQNSTMYSTRYKILLLYNNRCILNKVMNLGLGYSSTKF